MAEINWKYNIGDHIKDNNKDGSVKRDMIIIDRKTEPRQIKRKNNKIENYNTKYYKYHCNVCGRNSNWICESNLFYRQDGCPHRNILEIEWKYDIDDVIVDYNDDGSIKRNLTIIDRKIELKNYNSVQLSKGYRTRKVKYYKCRCNICGYENWIYEGSVFHDNRGCPCCCNQVVVKGVNDVATTHPHLVQYFKNKDEAFEHPAGTNYCPELICPNCGYVKTKLSIATLKNHGFGCHMCSDGISYPEKFIHAFLYQLGVEYKCQLTRTTYEWCDKYRYDFWFKHNEEEYIVEANGIQHYDERLGWSDNQDDIDKNKKLLAAQNGFDNKHYIVLDCRYSNSEWIKTSILNSAFNQLFDLSKIEWNKCAEQSLKSIMVAVCEYWERNKELNASTAAIADIFCITQSTVNRYLKNGNELNICVYNSSDSAKMAAKQRSKRVVVLNKQQKPIKIYYSISEIERNSIEDFGQKLSNGSLRYVCSEKKTHYFKGYYFWYLEDYIKKFGEDALKGIA